MSAQSGEHHAQVSDDLGLLAPKFRQAVIEAIDTCNKLKYDAKVYEAFRSQELQQLYYARGRTVIPPKKPVTNAPTNLFSWHGYGLAVDVVHARYYWTPPDGEAWFAKVAAVFKGLGLCKWGGDWKTKDTPHFQWGQCQPSPSQEARDLLARSGLTAVWQRVGAA